MRRALSFCLLLCLPLAAQVAPIPTPTQLSGNPFFIKKTWIIGGAGNWDYLTMDPQAQRLYIAHGRAVQVFDVESGSVVAEIPGFREAHAIALDDTGEYGYVSDGLADAVVVFDRSTFKIQATIPILCSPRSIAFEPQSKLVLAVCSANLPAPRALRPGERPSQPLSTGLSHVIAIDTGKNAILADILVAGDFRYAQSDGAGHVYVTVAPANRELDRNGSVQRHSSPPRIAVLDASSIANEAHRAIDGRSDSSPNEFAHLDWSEERNSNGVLHFIPLRSNCESPQGLAIDSKNLRLFIACENQDVQVLNASSGDVVTSLTTGPSDDVVAYDPDRSLIFSANGAGYGSLTIISQDANTDSYAVIQNLATLAHARTLAVDSSTGNVYLVTDFTGVVLPQNGGFGTIKTTPIQGSFQVLVVGH
jgi:DNA-binding beta-propeller fold protein YncE